MQAYAILNSDNIIIVLRFHACWPPCARMQHNISSSSTWESYNSATVGPCEGKSFWVSRHCILCVIQVLQWYELAIHKMYHKHNHKVSTEQRAMWNWKPSCFFGAGRREQLSQQYDSKSWKQHRCERKLILNKDSVCICVRHNYITTSI